MTNTRRYASCGQAFEACDCAHCGLTDARALPSRRKAKIMTSVLSLLTVDIVGLLAALSIWTASFLLLLRSHGQF